MKFLRKLKRDADEDMVPIGTLSLNVHVGKFLLEAEAELQGRYVLEGDTIDDLATHPDYAEVRPEVVRTLRTLATMLEEDDELEKFIVTT